MWWKMHGKKHKRPWGIQAGACALIALISCSATALATGLADAATPTGDAFLRTAHLSPDTPGVDVYLLASGSSKPIIIRNETYGHFSPYLDVAAGTYAVSTRAAGSAATSKPLLSWTMTLTAGDAYTAAVLGTGIDRRGTVLHDDLTAPAKGKARVRLIQAASNAPEADVTANGNVAVADDARFASATGYVSLPAGTWPLTAQSTGAKPLKVAASISLASGSVTSVVLLDSPAGGLRLTSALDSAAPGVTPTSGINTGGGGLALEAQARAASDRTLGWDGLELGGIAGATGTVLVVARRRRATWR